MRFLLNDALNFSGEVCLAWPYNKDEHGYPLVRNKGRARRAHRILCEAAHGPQPSPERKEVAHGCGKPCCVNPRHLRWATPKENQADKILHGTTNRGERQGRSKLTASDVLRIRELEGKVSRREIAEMFGVRSGAIDKIIWGQRWSWL
ncbi:HNH endonuclease signature motif containing protein [Mesorhizobium sp. ESP-6-2]|uniref:HNH endonuclease signature motif containing protein n=1 Tax=Mesorhizobium sp. ESP-6-2 TaxID=2876625 RepID=UPI001CCF4644|nr:HNH endonuclease [Mesorhizobium sp. ESP-6-2]